MTGRTQTVDEYLREAEARGDYDPNCKTCVAVFLPEVEKGGVLWNVFAPPHKASPRCQSGKYPHCTCDTCF